MLVVYVFAAIGAIVVGKGASIALSQAAERRFHSNRRRIYEQAARNP